MRVDLRLRSNTWFVRLKVNLLQGSWQYLGQYWLIFSQLPCPLNDGQKLTEGQPNNKSKKDRIYCNLYSAIILVTCACYYLIFQKNFVKIRKCFLLHLKYSFHFTFSFHFLLLVQLFMVSGESWKWNNYPIMKWLA